MRIAKSNEIAPPLNRGFTLVELMIVVAIIGVLAALAIYGVKAYLNHSKTAEIRQTLGAISRSAAAAFENENTSAELLSTGSSASNTSGGTLCDSADQFVPHPISGIYGKKYQPDSANNKDFNQDSSTKGWRCLKFSISQPISYAYRYTRNSSSNVVLGNQCGSKDNFYAFGLGNVDGDNLLAYYSRCGKVANGQLKLSTQLHAVNEAE